MGPMRAACRFARGLEAAGLLDRVARVQVDLYGSLALTGMGHGTDRAVLLGLAGNEPASIDPAAIESTVDAIRAARRMSLAGARSIRFEESRDLICCIATTMFPPARAHSIPTGCASAPSMRRAQFWSERPTFPSAADSSSRMAGRRRRGPYKRRSALSLSQRSGAAATAQAHELTISQLMLENECALVERCFLVARPWSAPASKNLADDAGVRPPRHDDAGNLARRLQGQPSRTALAERLRETEVDGRRGDALAPLDWVTVFAMAVNEENAAGGRVVTAPTNGAAGVVPAVAHYYARFIPGADDEGILRFFLTSAAIGLLYKENASISGAEVGCQGEVGVACSMAAGGLTAALGGSNGQVEHAAEIAMEHNLGMTCDPSPAWCRSPASSATPWARPRRCSPPASP